MVLFFDQRGQSFASSVSFSFLRCGSLPREPRGEGPEKSRTERRAAHRNSLEYFSATEDSAEGALPPQTSFLAGLGAFAHVGSFSEL